MKSKTIRPWGKLAALTALLVGCAEERSNDPELARATQALAPLPPDVTGTDAGNAAWVEQVMPLLLGRPVRSYGELTFLVNATARYGRGRVARALMRDPAFVERWTGVLLDRLRVDREGTRSQDRCFRTPRLTTNEAQIAAANVVLHTRRVGHDATIDPGEPDASSPPGTYNMADVVRGSILLDNLFPAYRGFVFALSAQRGGEDAESIKRRQIADHFTQVYFNKSMTCLQCHRSTFSWTPTWTFHTPGDSWTTAQETRVFPGLAAWAGSDESMAANDRKWTGSFANYSEEDPEDPGIAPFAGWSRDDCGKFLPDVSHWASTGTGLVLPPEQLATLWSLDDRLKEGYLALRASFRDRTPLVDGSGRANEGRTLGAYWLAAAVANDVWKEVFGSPLTIANHVSRNEAQRNLLWHLAEQHVVGREWSLRGLLEQIVTSQYFNRTPSSGAVMPKLFEPFRTNAPDPAANDYVADGVHRRSADLLFRMKASALGWTGPSFAVTHFPGASGTYPNRSAAAGMGLYLSRLRPASATSSQESMLAWESVGGTCARPPGVTRDWIDGLHDRAMTGGATVGDAVEALRFRLLGHGTANDAERNAIGLFLEQGLTDTYASVFASTGNAALRDLCAVFTKSPQFMLGGIPAGWQTSSSAPALTVGDLQPSGALANDTPGAACSTWSAAFSSVGIPTLSCVTMDLPTIDWDRACPSGRCAFRDDLSFAAMTWPCATCTFAPTAFSARPPRFDPRENTAPIPLTPASGVFLAWAEGAQLTSVGGDVKIVRKDLKVEAPQAGMKLGIGDSLDLGEGAAFKIVATDGKVFENPTGGMPKPNGGGRFLFMITGQGAIGAPAVFTPKSADPALQSVIAANMNDDLKNEEEDSFSFVHQVTAPSGNSSFLDHPELNGKQDRVLLVTARADGTANARAVGVWYSTSTGKWAVYNEDLASMPVGAKFTVRVMLPSSSAFVHRVTTSNLSGHVTYIDNPSLNGRPSIALQVTHVWNPPGASGVYNNHPIGVWYDGGARKWAIYNEDIVAMPNGASFAVKVGGFDWVRSTTTTRVGNALVIDNPSTNNAPTARLFVTHSYNPPAVPAAYHRKYSALRYDVALGKWVIVNLDGTQVADNVSFNIHRGY